MKDNLTKPPTSSDSWLSLKPRHIPALSTGLILIGLPKSSSVWILLKYLQTDNLISGLGYVLKKFFSLVE